MLGAEVPPGDRPKLIKPGRDEHLGEVVGHLVVSLKDGSGLPSSSFGDCDPYVRVGLAERGGQPRLRAISSVKNTPHPRWDEYFEVPVHDVAQGELVLQVLDHNSTKMRADHAVGEVSVPVIDVIHSNGTPQAARSMPLQPMPERDGPASPGGVTDLADSGRKNKWLGKLEFHVNFVPLKGARMQLTLHRCRYLVGDSVAHPAASIYATAMLGEDASAPLRCPSVKSEGGEPIWDGEGHLFDLPMPSPGQRASIKFYRAKGTARDVHIGTADLEVREGRLVGYGASGAPPTPGIKSGGPAGSQWVCIRPPGGNAGEAGDALISSKLTSSRDSAKNMLRDLGLPGTPRGKQHPKSAAASPFAAEPAEPSSGWRTPSKQPVGALGDAEEHIEELSPGRIRMMSPSALERALSRSNPEAVAKLTSRQIASLSANQLTAVVPYLTPRQLASVQPEQTAGYSADQLRGLDGARLETVLPHLTPRQVAGLPPDTLAKFSPGGLSCFSPGQARSLDSAQLSSLGSGQLSAVLDRLTPAQVSSMPKEAIASLPPHKLFAMDVDQGAALTGGQIMALDSKQLTAVLSKLEPRQTSRIPPDKLARLSPSELDVLSTAQARALTPQQLGALGWEQLGALKSKLSRDQLSGLSPSGSAWGAEIRRFSPIQIRNLSPLQLSEVICRLSPGQLACVDEEQISLLPPRAFKDMKPALLAAMTPRQVRAMLPEHLDCLSAAQVGALLGMLSPDQIGSLGAAVLPGKMTGKQIARMKPDQLEGMTPLQVSQLAAEQFSMLSPAQLAAILPLMRPEQVAGLHPRQIAELGGGQLARMTGAQVAALTHKQIAEIGPRELNEILPLLSQEQIAKRVSKMPAAHLPLLNLSSAQLSALLPKLSDAQLAAILENLTPEQIKSLPASRLRRLLNGNFKLNRMQRKAAMEQLARLEELGNTGENDVVKRVVRGGIVASAALLGWSIYRYIFPSKRRYRIKRNDTLWHIRNTRTAKRYTIRKIVNENTL